MNKSSLEEITIPKEIKNKIHDKNYLPKREELKVLMTLIYSNKKIFDNEFDGVDFSQTITNGLHKNITEILRIERRNISHLLGLTSSDSSLYSFYKKAVIDKIINNIDIKDLLTNDNGTYNNTYYQVKNELNVTEEEMNILMNSEPLNNKLKLVLDSIVKYSLRNNKEAKYSNDEMYNMIIEGINSTPNISEELKNKVIISSDRHKQDISDFLYDIEVSLKGD